MPPHLRAAGLGALADLVFRSLDNDVPDPVIVTGFHASPTHKLTPGQKTSNQFIAVGRAPVEHRFARPRTDGSSLSSAPIQPAPSAS
ncbi:hypothetical protein ACFV8E_10355 [Streptomyces sp. NPDC059849]|uniref:hypothetical protein n=1 Tax=Streptomyces sp. NPDC059849 TaxID=3346969 RepID=UPI003666807C